MVKGNNMGLDIRSSIKSERFGGYNRIHILRKWVYEFVEGNSREDIDKFYALPTGKYEQITLKDEKCSSLLNHSDCDGCYIDYKYFGIVNIETDGSLRIGDLTKLAEELAMLKNKYYEEMPPLVKEVFDDLCSYIFYDEIGNEDFVSFLEFS